jgi:hypothetical protein
MRTIIFLLAILFGTKLFSQENITLQSAAIYKENKVKTRTSFSDRKHSYKIVDLFNEDGILIQRDHFTSKGYRFEVEKFDYDSTLNLLHQKATIFFNNDTVGLINNKTVETTFV